MNFDAIIIGGGAAGLFCALTAGRRGKRVLVVEHNAEVGRKIIISGGGRCNFTNRSVTAENFVSQNPHFAKSALARYTSGDFVELVRKHKIAYYEKTLGQLFCRESSRSIVEMLLAECRAAKVKIETSCTVKSVSHDETFVVETSKGTFQSNSLVVACGGLSFAKIGATDLGYKIAKQFALKLVDTRPSLVALALQDESYKQLAGLSHETIVTTEGQSFRENILFTHRGLSGPAILQISNYWKRDQAVDIDLVPDRNIADIIEENRTSRQNLDNFLSEFLPKRFADEFAARHFGNKPLYQMNRSELDSLIETLSNWTVKFGETEGYDRAEVTLGGVSTAELSSQTMESKRQKGLYFIGEIVDVTGWLGGYNFQWAWSSGFAAGTAI